VVTGPGCPWNVVVNDDWLGYSGKEMLSDGYGYARFNIRTNEGPFRTAKVVVAGKTIEFRQGAGNLTAVSSASYAGTIAPGSIATVFGQELASRTETAQTLPLPKLLGGAQVNVIVIGYGGFGAPLFFVSPGQINFQVPENLPLGTTLIDVYNGNEFFSRGVLKVEKIAPSLFTADATGQGFPAAVAVRVKTDGRQNYEAGTCLDTAQNKIVARSVDFSGDDQGFFFVFVSGNFGH